jgi:glutamate-1-semialdehyde 2,1-aminomutase
VLSQLSQRRRRVPHTSAALAEGIEHAFAETGVAGHVRRAGSMLQPFFSEHPDAEPVSVAEVSGPQDDALFAAFCDALEARGVLGHRYPLGRWFVSLAHTSDDVDETVAAVRDALAEMAENRESG